MRQFEFVGAGVMRGRLYDLGAFPGAVIDEACDAKIIGEVFSFPDDEIISAQLLDQLDDYEDYTPADEPQSLFIRKRTTIRLLNGAKVECWVYVYNRDTDQARLIAQGDYAKRNKASESA